MKVKVSYYGYHTTEVEVDDKFKDTIPAYERGDDDTYESLSDELHYLLARQIPGEISSVSDSDNNTIYEL
jgi:hypothetical protein